MNSLYTTEVPVASNCWQNTGVKNTCVWQVTVNEVNPNVVFAAFWDMGLWRSMDHGSTWESCNNLGYSGNWTEPLINGTQQGIGGNSHSVVTDPARANMVWAALGGDQGQTLYLLKSTNYGEFDSWQPSSGLPATYNVYGLSIDRHSPSTNRILFCTADGDVYRSANDGSGWSSVLTGMNCQCTQVDYTNSNYVYAGGDGGFFRSSAGGNAASWTNVGLAEMTAVSCIQCDPSNPGWIYVACYGNGSSVTGLYRSTNRGATWQKILADYFLQGVAVDSKNSNNLYAASSSNESWGWYDTRSQGVLYSRNCGLTWQQANEGLSWPFAFTLAVDGRNPSYVFLGSPGSGFQRRQFTDLVTIRVNALAIQNGQFQLSWNCDPGWNYQVMKKSRLSDAWTNVALVPSVGEATNYWTYVNPATRSFYQVVGFAP
jgi:hypothetical protein